jgi:hypothetical protein
MFTREKIDKNIISHSPKPFSIIDWSSTDEANLVQYIQNIATPVLRNRNKQPHAQNGVSPSERRAQQKNAGSGIQDTITQGSTRPTSAVQNSGRALNRKKNRNLYEYQFSFSIDMDLVTVFKATTLRVTFFSPELRKPDSILAEISDRKTFNTPQYHLNRQSLFSNRKFNTDLATTEAYVIQEFDITYLINNQQELLQAGSKHPDIFQTLMSLSSVITAISNIQYMNVNLNAPTHFNFAGSDDSESSDRSSLLDSDSQAGSDYLVASNISEQNSNLNARADAYGSLIKNGKTPSQYYNDRTRNYSYSGSGLDSTFYGPDELTTAIERMVNTAGNNGGNPANNSGEGVVIVNKNAGSKRDIVANFSVIDSETDDVPNVVEALIEVFDSTKKLLQFTQVSVPHASLKNISAQSVYVDLNPHQRVSTIPDPGKTTIVNESRSKNPRKNVTLRLENVVTDRNNESNPVILEVRSKRVDSTTNRSEAWVDEGYIEAVSGRQVNIRGKDGTNDGTVDTTDSTILRVQSKNGTNLRSGKNFRDVVVKDEEVSDDRGKDRGNVAAVSDTKTLEQLPRIFATIKPPPGAGIAITVVDTPKKFTHIRLVQGIMGNNVMQPKIPWYSLSSQGENSNPEDPITFLDDQDLISNMTYYYRLEYKTLDGLEGQCSDSCTILYKIPDNTASVSANRHADGLSLDTSWDVGVVKTLYQNVINNNEIEFADVKDGFDSINYASIAFYKIDRINQTTGDIEHFYSGQSSVISFPDQEKLLKLSPTDSGNFMFDIEVYLQIPATLLPLIFKVVEAGTTKEYAFSELEFFNKSTLETGTLTKDYSNSKNIDSTILYLGSPSGTTKVQIKPPISSDIVKVSDVMLKLITQTPSQLAILLQWTQDDPGGVIDHYVITLVVAGSSVEVGFVAAPTAGNNNLQYHHKMEDISYELVAPGCYTIKAINSQYVSVAEIVSDSIDEIAGIEAILPAAAAPAMAAQNTSNRAQLKKR